MVASNALEKRRIMKNRTFKATLLDARTRWAYKWGYTTTDICIGDMPYSHECTVHGDRYIARGAAQSANPSRLIRMAVPPDNGKIAVKFELKRVLCCWEERIVSTGAYRRVSKPLRCFKLVNNDIVCASKASKSPSLLLGRGGKPENLM